MSLDIIIAILNVSVLGATLLVAYGAYRSQRIHNYNSVKPILQLDLGDYEDDIYVRIYNNGVGPGIIKSIEIVKQHDGSIRKDLIGYFENLDWEWDVFNTGLEGIAISPNAYTYFIEMKNPDEQQKLKLRNTLKDVHIKIEYSDIYNNYQPLISTTLDWFGRNSSLRKSKAKIKQRQIINFDAKNIAIFTSDNQQ